MYSTRVQPTRMQPATLPLSTNPGIFRRTRDLPGTRANLNVSSLQTRLTHPRLSGRRSIHNGKYSASGRGPISDRCLPFPSQRRRPPASPRKSLSLSLTTPPWPPADMASNPTQSNPYPTNRFSLASFSFMANSLRPFYRLITLPPRGVHETKMAPSDFWAGCSK